MPWPIGHIQFNWIVQRNLDNIISRINAFDSVRWDCWIKLSNILRVLIREISHCWKQCAIKKTWFDNGEKGIAWIFPSSYRVTIYNRDNGMRYSKLKGLVDSHTHILSYIKRMIIVSLYHECRCISMKMLYQMVMNFHFHYIRWHSSLFFALHLFPIYPVCFMSSVMYFHRIEHAFCSLG